MKISRRKILIHKASKSIPNVKLSFQNRQRFVVIANVCVVRLAKKEAKSKEKKEKKPPKEKKDKPDKEPKKPKEKKEKKGSR